MYKCYGFIQGEYPIFIPRESKLEEKLIEEAHIHTIHGAVTLTMAKIRSKYWVDIKAVSEKSFENMLLM